MVACSQQKALLTRTQRAHTRRLVQRLLTAVCDPAHYNLAVDMNVGRDSVLSVQHAGADCARGYESNVRQFDGWPTKRFAILCETR